MTLTLHWWCLPILLACAGSACLYWATTKSGWLGGLFETFFALAFFAAALASLVTGLLV